MRRELVDVKVIETRTDVSVEEAMVEIAAYVRDHEGVDPVDLMEALLIPIEVVEEAAERLVSEGKLRHVP
jgi:hypothetical protein